MGDFLDFPTVIVIVVAIVVLLRLRSVLGTRTGNERPPTQRYENISRTRPDNDDTVIANGWAELHPLAGRYGLPANIVMVYGPRDDEEFPIVADLLRASHSWGSD
jgi:hypothetical protein